MIKTVLLLVSFVLACSAFAAPNSWEAVPTAGEPTARHEAAFVAFDGKVFLLGGRRINPVDVFDPKTNTWKARSSTPIELHHFQAVPLGDAIYLMGAMTGPFPNETPIAKVIVYHPAEDRFEFTHTIPTSRRRGGAGAVAYQGKIYMIGGIVNGHISGFQPWFDEYDPRTGEWTPLPDAPHARDHFQAVVHENRLYAVGGRRTSHETAELFGLTVPEIDVYDFATGEWLATEESPTLPTPRAGNMAFVWGDEIVVAGGETNQAVAHEEVEAFNVRTGKWRRWPGFARARHGTGIAAIDGVAYTASGSGNRGGGPELTSVERLPLSAIQVVDE